MSPMMKLVLSLPVSIVLLASALTLYFIYFWLPNYVGFHAAAVQWYY